MPPPQTTTAAKPLPSAVSSATQDATSSSSEGHSRQKHDEQHDEQHTSLFPHPKLRLEVRDITHPGAVLFFSSIHATKTITTAVANVLRLLYHSPSDPSTKPPPTRSITIVFRDMPGVAYTTGSDLDDDHKEIHFALDHIAPNTDPSRAPAEITGVLTHEIVHCLQWNARGTCPGGLIEGIADWVRLRCDLAPPHWKRDHVPDKWDGGYQDTAYFLEYLERERFGCGFVRRVNEKLRLHKYHEETFWLHLTGMTVGQLFKEYVEHLKSENSKKGQEGDRGDKSDKGDKTDKSNTE
ncbi:hypothetical protein E4U43_006379 [Claviceps pusilla]|uniref:Pathogenesis-related protein NtPRp27 n=1 Tax=Claviceps pusilla TaxID=123648 RepID=A0A9P7N3D9_9HYPO|nr:hypothetical protein E4U43_006379 [Claviceps pusilla]